MKVDRRSFLGLGLGAVAGVAASPVGIKLTDDLSIWTQNWSWTPVPVDGNVNFETSVCSICPGGCGINVRKIDHQPVKIEGLDQYPVNDGGACLHGIAGLQYLYDPSRIKTPLKRNGDSFEEISWDEAVAMVAGRLDELRKKGTPEKAACIVDKKQGSVSGLFQRLLKTVGSSNFYTMPSLASHLELTASTLHGKGKTLAFDLENSDFILSFGAGLIEGWGSPVSCFKANASRKERHAKLVQVEPRLSNTAANADQWLPIKPGSYGDLALGMCAVILRDKLYDGSATVHFTGGINKLTAFLDKEYTLSKTANITGVKTKDIEKIAHSFAKAKKPVAIFGNGRGDGAQSLREMTAVQFLNCLVGNLNKKGGVFVKQEENYLTFPNTAEDAVAKKGNAQKPVADNVYDLFNRIDKADSPEIDTLLVYNANPGFSMHNTGKIKQAMDKIPFKAAFSSYLDETAAQCDVILPSHIFLERYEDVLSITGVVNSVAGLSKPIVKKPLFNTRHPGDTVILIGKAIGGSVAQDFGWFDYTQCLENVTTKISGGLAKEGFVKLTQAMPIGRPPVKVSYLVQNPSGNKMAGDGDLTLIPIDNMRLISGATAASPFAVKTVSDNVIKGKDTVVEINPATAKGLKNNDVIELSTPVGSAKVQVHLNEGIMPGVIGMVTGLGHDLNNKYVSDKGVNINDLVDQVIEPGSGLDAAFGIQARISKA